MKTCPYCAEEIQDAATLCRYCGTALAVSHHENRGEIKRGAAPASGFSFSAVFLGWIVAEVLGLLSGFVLGYLLTSGTIDLSAYALWINILSVVVYFVGGLVTGARALHDGLRHGSALAALAVVSALITATLLNLPITSDMLPALAIRMIAAVIGTLFVTN